MCRLGKDDNLGAHGKVCFSSVVLTDNLGEIRLFQELQAATFVYCENPKQKPKAALWLMFLQTLVIVIQEFVQSFPIVCHLVKAWSFVIWLKLDPVGINSPIMSLNQTNAYWATSDHSYKSDISGLAWVLLF